MQIQAIHVLVCKHIQIHFIWAKISEMNDYVNRYLYMDTIVSCINDAGLNVIKKFNFCTKTTSCLMKGGWKGIRYFCICCACVRACVCVCARVRLCAEVNSLETNTELTTLVFSYFYFYIWSRS